MVSSVASAFAAAADDEQALHKVNGLWDLAGECVAWMHARTMIAIAQVLLQPGLSKQEVRRGKGLTRLLLRALAKDAQPCHNSEWVSLAGELQLIGLAHGDAALSKRSAEAATLIRATGDVAAAADLLWVFLTAKALEENLINAVEALALDQCSSALSNVTSAIAAILCALAQPCVGKMLGIKRLLRLAVRFAEHMASRVQELPVGSLPRLALALAELLEMGQGNKEGSWQSLGQALSAVSSAAALRLPELSLEDLADFCVALSLAECSDLIDAFAMEVSWRIKGHSKAAVPIPGAAVVLRATVGPWPPDSRGLLGEFCLASGRWRVWLDSGVGVDASERDFELLDNGARPQRCCYECWRLSPRLWRTAADSTRALPIHRLTDFWTTEY